MRFTSTLLLLLLAIGCSDASQSSLDSTVDETIDDSHPDRKYQIYGGRLKESDLDEIESLVAKLTEDAILTIDVRRPNVVEVKTGVVRGPLDGGGVYYEFEKKDGRWVRINEKGSKSWVS